MLGLPVVPELGDGARLAVGHEDRVVAEALAPARLERDRALDGGGAAKRLALRRERDELAHVARAPVLDALQRVEQRGHPVVRPTRRLDPGPSAERGDLDPRVLAEHPVGRVPTAEARLAERVVVVGLALLDRKSTRLNSSHSQISYAAFCLKKKTRAERGQPPSTRF